MYIQHAAGNFQVTVGGEWHCGPDNDNPKTLQYEIKIEYPDDALDEHGFLLDNLCFQQYFDSIQYTEDSCELLAYHAGDHFFKAINRDDCRVHADVKVPGLADIEYVEDPTPDSPGYKAHGRRGFRRLTGMTG